MVAGWGSWPRGWGWASPAAGGRAQVVGAARAPGRRPRQLGAVRRLAPGPVLSRGSAEARPESRGALLHAHAPRNGGGGAPGGGGGRPAPPPRGRAGAGG